MKVKTIIIYKWTFKEVIFRKILHWTCSFWKIKNIVKEILDVTKKVIMCGYGSLTVPKIENFLLIYLWKMLLG